MQLFPYQCYTPDSFLDAISGMLPILMSLSWVFTVAITVKNIVWEKESRQKEIMRIMGLSGGTLWASWWIDTMFMMLISCLGLSCIVKFGDIFHFSNWAITFLYLFGYAFASAGVAFLISTFFSSANLSAACGGIIYFFLYLPYNMCAIWSGQIGKIGKYFTCLIPTVALGYGSWQFGDLEKEGTGTFFFTSKIFLFCDQKPQQNDYFLINFILIIIYTINLYLYHIIILIIIYTIKI